MITIILDERSHSLTITFHRIICESENFNTNYIENHERRKENNYYPRKTVTHPGLIMSQSHLFSKYGRVFPAIATGIVTSNHWELNSRFYFRINSSGQDRE